MGPDMVAPWRRPSVVIVYAIADFPLDGFGLVEAQGIADANVIVREPADRSVFATPSLVAEFDGVELPRPTPPR
ncbi:MAG: hypothetical protein ACYDHU_12825 [Acidimicrobiales bacterium]